MVESGPYKIVDDDSGHKYIIPLHRGEEWDAWLNGQDWEDGILPGTWAERIDGSFRITGYYLDRSTTQAEVKRDV